MLVPQQGATADSTIQLVGSGWGAASVLEAAMRDNTKLREVATRPVEVVVLGGPELYEEAVDGTTQPEKVRTWPSLSDTLRWDGLVILFLVMAMMIPGTRCWLGDEENSIRSLAVERGSTVAPRASPSKTRAESRSLGLEEGSHD